MTSPVWECRKLVVEARIFFIFIFGARRGGVAMENSPVSFAHLAAVRRIPMGAAITDISPKGRGATG